MGIGEENRVADALAERLAERTALLFELLADLDVLVHRLGELARADLVEP